LTPVQVAARQGDDARYVLASLAAFNPLLHRGVRFLGARDAGRAAPAAAARAVGELLIIARLEAVATRSAPSAGRRGAVRGAAARDDRAACWWSRPPARGSRRAPSREPTARAARRWRAARRGRFKPTR